MGTTHKNCQSCGMPLGRDAQGGGTNADGRFTLPDLTVEQMQDRVRDTLREFGVPAPLGWFFTRRVPKLARWAARD